MTLVKDQPPISNIQQQWTSRSLSRSRSGNGATITPNLRRDLCGTVVIKIVDSTYQMCRKNQKHVWWINGSLKTGQHIWKYLGTSAIRGSGKSTIFDDLPSYKPPWWPRFPSHGPSHWWTYIFQPHRIEDLHGRSPLSSATNGIWWGYSGDIMGM